jgi:hypothetical protein
MASENQGTFRQGIKRIFNHGSLTGVLIAMDRSGLKTWRREFMTFTLWSTNHRAIQRGFLTAAISSEQPAES